VCLQALWCISACPYTGVGIPVHRAFNCSDQHCVAFPCAHRIVKAVRPLSIKPREPAAESSDGPGCMAAMAEQASLWKEPQWGHPHHPWYRAPFKLP
jgi:hypothetical protein